MPARDVLEVINDRSIQIFFAKLDEYPAGWAIPVQRMPAILEPFQVLGASRRGCLAQERAFPPSLGAS
jgi:hypothetical protein